MAEPHTSSFFVTVTTIGIALSALFPLVDGNALIGAFAGSSLVAISSKNLTLLKRLAYMAISLVAGYLAAPEVITHTMLRETGVAAFFCFSSVHNACPAFNRSDSENRSSPTMEREVP